MLIYNFQKEFLGIDEKDLHTLGYKDLAQLRTEVSDFADLFVKTPGYIHNFQHVHWIDFITCAESNEESKVIINTSSKSYRAIITITNAYLVDNPSQKAYLIHLNNLRALTPQEYDNISNDVIQKPIPQAAPTEQAITQKKEKNKVIQDEYDIPSNVEKDLDKMLDIGDLSIETQAPEKPVEKEPILETEPQLHVTPQKEYVAPKKELEEQPKNTYVFDPHIASKELGLPLDLIEEFIQDFIDQANDFKNGLYTALEEGDINNVKILSHKLKGVAANLRIEDAHEVLSIVNAASDADIIKMNLDNFYNIIAKLSTKEVTDVAINDEEVPQKINLPELSDDEFIAPDDEKLELIPQEPEELLEFKEEEIEETPLEIQKKEAKPEIATEPTLNFKEEPEIEAQNEEKYSKEKIAKEIGLDLESFNELFKDFVKEASNIFEKINNAIVNDDYKTVQRQALKLKGMSDNMRMHAFTNKLETLMHSTDKNAVTQAVTQIDKVLTTISKEED